MPKNRDINVNSGLHKHTHVALKLILVLLFLIIAFVSGKFIGFSKIDCQYTNVSIVNDEVGRNGDYNEKNNVAMDDVTKKLVDMNLVRSNVTILPSVEVKSVDGQNVNVEFDASYLDILKTGLVTKTIQVPSGFVIEQRTQKSAEEIQKLVEEYRLSEKQYDLSNPENTEFYQPFQSYDITKFSIKDLKEGDILRIESNDNILGVNIIEPSSIVLISSAISDNQ